MPGFPTADTNGGVDLAIYCKIPGVGVMSSGDLITVMVASVTDIQNDHGMLKYFHLLILRLILSSVRERCLLLFKLLDCCTGY